MLNSGLQQRIPLPPNNTLAGLPILLDVEAVRQCLNAAGCQLENGEVFYRWYKPGTNCIVAYRFQVKDEARTVIYYGKSFTREAYPPARQKALCKRWDQPLAGPAVIPLDSAAGLLYAFPNDAELSGLGLLGTQRELRRFLQQHLLCYPAEEWRLPKKALRTEVVRYKPERRAVLRSRVRVKNRQSSEREKVRVYWRADKTRQAGDTFRAMRLVRQNLPDLGEVTVPRPLGFDPEAQVLLMEALPGQPLVEVLETDQATLAVERTGAALAQLHALTDIKLPTWSPLDFLRQVSETSGALAAISPELASPALRVFAKLQQAMPASTENPTFVHGDFSYDQILIGPKQIGVVDLDHAHSGSRLTDIGEFLAHLKRLDLEKRRTESDHLANRFLDSYARLWKEKPQPREVQWWTALSLFRFAGSPFFHLEPNWPEMVGAILDAAEEALC